MYSKQRLYLTADKQKLVRDGDKRAAFLYAVPGDEIPEAAARKFGLVDGGLPEKGKSSVPPVKQTGPAGSDDDLTRLKGVGKATAKALSDAGIVSFAALAAIDPKKPPVMVTGAGEADWIGWVAQAKEMSSGNE